MRWWTVGRTRENYEGRCQWFCPEFKESVDLFPASKEVHRPRSAGFTIEDGHLLFYGGTQREEVQEGRCFLVRPLLSPLQDLTGGGSNAHTWFTTESGGMQSHRSSPLSREEAERLRIKGSFEGDLACSRREKTPHSDNHTHGNLSRVVKFPEHRLPVNPLLQRVVHAAVGREAPLDRLTVFIHLFQNP